MLNTPIKPMLLTAGSVDLAHPDYIFEPKYDGFRLLSHKKYGRMRIFTRNGNDITDKLPEFQPIGDNIRGDNVILDCEGVVIRDGRPVFDDFSYRGRSSNPTKIAAAVKSHPATLIPFDVLYDGDELLRAPLIERKERLAEIVEPGPGIVPTHYVGGEGGALLYDWTKDNKWEGVVAKRRDSRYHLDTRTAEWVKMKHWRYLDCVILGYRMKPTFAIVVGAHFRTVQNKPLAVVEYGMTRDERTAFLRIATDIHTHKDRKGTQWIEPKLCCRVQYLEHAEFTHNLRTVSFKGFLFDKQPADCRWVG